MKVSIIHSRSNMDTANLLRLGSSLLWAGKLKKGNDCAPKQRGRNSAETTERDKHCKYSQEAMDLGLSALSMATKTDAHSRK